MQQDADGLILSIRDLEVSFGGVPVELADARSGTATLQVEAPGAGEGSPAGT